jgi:hypothetical protein
MPTQNHIHLDTTLGGAPENAPPKTYKTNIRTPFIEGDIDVKRTWTGKLFFNTRKTTSGTPILLKNVDYQLLVTEAQWNELINMLHREVYLVDHIHPNNGEDHTGSVRSMVFATLKYLRRFDPDLNKHVVAVSFIDNDTVT